MSNSQVHIAVRDDGQHVLYRVPDGRTRVYLEGAYSTPRAACAAADLLMTDLGDDPRADT